MNLLIPGIGGSKIYCNCTERKIKLYPKKFIKLINNLNFHFFEKNCKVTTAPLKSIYNLSVYNAILKKIPTLQFYSYDWRRPPLEIAKELYKYLYENNHKEISLIGHSNGGYIIRILLEYLKFPKSFKTIFICSTPLYGSIDPFSYMYEDCVFDGLCGIRPTKKVKSITLTQRDIINIFKHYRESLIYYIPTQKIIHEDEAKMSRLTNVPIHIISNVKSIHLALSNFNCNRYCFYYNCSKLQSVIKSETELVNNFKIFSTRGLKKNGLHFNIDSDSFIVANYTIIPHTSIYYDNTFLSHAMNMNSCFLINSIKEKIK